MSEQAPESAVLEYATPSKRTAVDLFFLNKSSSWLILVWACFLACSWTWCIGMYLPVILTREYGIWSWLVFAIPNVAGAALMGTILKSRYESADLERNHHAACVWFSVITIAFQIFFAGWFLPRLLGPWSTTIAICTWGLLWVFGRTNTVRDLQSAMIVLWTSLVALAMFLTHHGPLELARHLGKAINTPPDAVGIGLLTPVIAFGFLLCPYLDLTFHAARQATNEREGRRAFGLGFGVFFLIMIFFTLLYSVLDLGLGRTEFAPTFLVGLHIVAQLAFTIVVHGRQLSRFRLPDRVVGGASILLVAAVALGFILSRSSLSPAWFEAESVYRVFMGFYGLVFPAYVWICMIPSPYARPTRYALTVFAVSVIISMPMYWLGFVMEREIWLMPGLAIVLLARLFIPRARDPGASGLAGSQPSRIST